MAPRVLVPLGLSFWLLIKVEQNGNNKLGGSMDEWKTWAMRVFKLTALAKINLVCMLAIILLLVLNHYINLWGGTL